MSSRLGYGWIVYCKYTFTSSNMPISILNPQKRHVDHNILDCNEHQEPLQPYLSDTPEKKEGGDKDWNVLAVCSIVKAINYAKIMGCGKNS